MLGLGAAAGIFLTRAPVLVLGDLFFDTLYGPRRALLRQAGASLRLFRPVKKVTVAENTGPDAVIFALEEASSRPWAVLAPYRHAQGLRRYAEQHPEITALILGGRENFREGQLLSLAADTRLDSYRAGRSAAFFAREKEGQILVLQEERDFPVNRDAFQAGLLAENCAVNPLYMSGYTEYPDYDNLSCVVLGGNAQAFLSRNRTVPVILFSWLDPAFSPANVKLIFDDSPWGIPVEAFQSAVEAGEGPVPSGITVFSGRIGRRDLLEKIKTVVREGIVE
ncbi:MAG: hypothetical protein LBH26_04940 [Treponema sp.]|nr:hypothetical protein [Treponema sp.]